jgi:hypothetical protein
MASSQLVRLPSGSHVSPDSSLPAKRTRRHAGPPVANLQLQQILHFVLLPAIRADHGRGLAGIATEGVGATEVGPKELDVELWEYAQRRSFGDVNLNAVRVGRRAREDGEGAHPARRQQHHEGRPGGCAPCRGAPRPPRRTSRPAGGRRAPPCADPPLLQPCSNLHRHVRHHVLGSLAGSESGGGHWVRCVGRGERATRVLTAVGVERRVLVA